MVEDCTTYDSKFSDDSTLNDVLLQNKTVTRATLEKVLPTLSPSLVFPLIKQHGSTAFAQEVQDLRNRGRAKREEQHNFSLLLNSLFL